MSTQTKMIWTRLDGKRYNPSKMLRQEGFFETYLEKFATLEDVEEWKNNMSQVQKTICRDVYINKMLEGDPLPVREGLSIYEFELRVKKCRYRNKKRIDKLKFNLKEGTVQYGTWTTVTANEIRIAETEPDDSCRGALLKQIKEQLKWNTQNIRRNTQRINQNRQHLSRVMALQMEANRFIFGPGRTRSSQSSH